MIKIARDNESSEGKLKKKQTNKEQEWKEGTKESEANKGRNHQERKRKRDNKTMKRKGEKERKEALPIEKKYRKMEREHEMN